MRAARGHIVVHEVSHSSGLEHAKEKVETSGPAHIVVVLEQTVNTAQWHFNYVKTDMKISSAYSLGHMYKMHGQSPTPAPHSDTKRLWHVPRINYHT